MRILAFDTSGARLSAALYENDRETAYHATDTGARHSSALLPAIGSVLRQAGVDMESVDVIAVCLGPGSFTGLRVGVAAAKVFGYTLKKPIVGVSSLEAMAMRSELEGRLAARIDARRGQVYAALYDKKGPRLKALKAPSLIGEDAFDGLARGFAVLRDDALPSDAAGVALAALSRGKAGAVDPYVLEPLYLRPRDCNVTPPKKR